jgi:oligoendopeptidase F
MEFVDLIRSQKIPRRFVQPNFHVKELERVKDAYEALLLRDLKDVHVLRGWIQDRGELETVLEEQAAIVNIVYSCDVQDPQKEADYLYLIQQLQPLKMKYEFLLNQKYVNCPHRSELDRSTYAMYDLLISNQIDLFRESNIALKTQEAEVEDRYSKLTGSLMVSFQGKVLTVPQLQPFMQDVDRNLRYQAFVVGSEAYLAKERELTQIFNELIPLRRKVAQNAGFESYTDYIFREKNRFDYTPKTCFEFHTSIEAEVVPRCVALRQKKAKALGLESIKPWDTTVDPKGRAPLKPFQTTAQLIEGCHRICQGLHPRMAAVFSKLMEYRTLDLESRKGKRPGGYQTDLPESKLQFIFMNAVGVQEDLVTLLHETGHAIHSAQASAQPLTLYRGYPIEMAEVASMAMELLGMQGYREFYSEEDVKRAQEEQMARVLTVLPWVATVDAFQHWIYAHPEHSESERKQTWVDIYSRFQPGLNWEDHPAYLEFKWQRQQHIYLFPFYYIEYGLAQIGALQVWKNVMEQGRAGLEQFLNGLRIGYSKSLPEQYAGVGIPFCFDLQTIRTVMSFVDNYLGQD